MKVFAVIPARGGSKSVPRKNIRPLFGRPLIAYTIAAAQASHLITHFVVSSEDAEILEVARRYGAPVPFVRPAELASDTAPSLPVAQHAVNSAEDYYQLTFDVVVLLQPTTPQRSAADIDAAIGKFLETGADSVVSVCDVGAYHPARMRQIVDDRLVELPIREPREMARRQDLPPMYIRNGALYVVKRDVVMKQNSMIGEISRPYIMPTERSINIDSEMDMLLAQMMMRPEEYDSIPRLTTE